MLNSYFFRSTQHCLAFALRLFAAQIRSAKIVLVVGCVVVLIFYESANVAFLKGESEKEAFRFL